MAATRFGMPLTKGEDFDKARTEQVLAKKLDEAWARVAQKQSDANSVAVFEDRLKTVAKEGDVKLGKIIEFAVLGVISANAFEMEKIECDIARTRDQLLTEITEYQTHLNQLREQKKKLGGGTVRAWLNKDRLRSIDVDITVLEGALSNARIRLKKAEEEHLEQLQKPDDTIAVRNLSSVAPTYCIVIVKERNSIAFRVSHPDSVVGSYLSEKLSAAIAEKSITVGVSGRSIMADLEFDMEALGINLVCDHFFWMPPKLDSVHKAEPGVYHIHHDDELML